MGQPVDIKKGVIMGVLQKAGSVVGGAISSFASSADDIARGVAKTSFKEYASDFARTAFEMTEESSGAYKSYVDSVAKDIARTGISSAGIPEDFVDIAKQSFKNTKGFTEAESSKIADLLEGSFGEKISSLRESTGTAYSALHGDSGELKNIAGRMRQSFDSGTMKEKGAVIGQTMESYFTGGPMKRNVTRIGGAVAGASVAGRILSGGNLTTTADGRKDIAGVPFF